MSDDEELKKLRAQRMTELQNQQAQQQQQEALQQQQKQALEAQKQMLLMHILSSEARSRLANIKLARPEFGANIELQLIQAYQSGALRGKTPMSDEFFKSLLMQLQNRTKKRTGKIVFK
ncbi:DNA-binding protein [Candidatus Harpocratesius sp.]